MQKIKNAVMGMRKKFQENLEASLFLIVGLCAGIGMIFADLPFQAPDATRHYLWAMDVSYGNLLRPLANISSHEDGVITVPDNLDEVKISSVKPGDRKIKKILHCWKTSHFSKGVTEKKEEGAFVSFFYYPMAFGLWLGRILGLSVYSCTVLPRLFNLAVFLALSWEAIRITPIRKNTLAVVALFPMTIYQAAACSPDAILNGMCFLFTSLCFFYAYGEKEHLSWKDMWKLGLLLSVIFLCKYVYVCLGLLVFLIPAKKFGTRIEYWKSFMAGLLPLLVFGVAGVFNMISAISGGPAVEGGVTQIGYLTAHPGLIIKVLLTTFMDKFNDYMQWLNTLGAVNYSLGPLIYIVPMTAVYIGAADSNAACSLIRMRDKIICFAAFAAVCIGVVMGIYIGDGQANEVGALVVHGVQGRYFIPVLPAFFGAFSLRGLQNQNPHFTEKAIGLMGVFLMYAVHAVHTGCF